MIPPLLAVFASVGRMAEEKVALTPVRSFRRISLPVGSGGHRQGISAPWVWTGLEWEQMLIVCFHNSHNIALRYGFAFRTQDSSSPSVWRQSAGSAKPVHNSHKNGRPVGFSDRSMGRRNLPVG